MPHRSTDALTDIERARAEALRKPADRDDFVAAHLLARTAAATLLRTADALTLVQRCPDCGGTDHGRPSIAEAPRLHLSLSHTHGYVAAVASPAPVAVDVEHALKAADDRLDALAETVLTPAERYLVRTALDPARTFAQLWVRKESLIKLGRATLDTLSTLDVSPALGRPTLAGHVLVAWESGDLIGAALSRDPIDHVDLTYSAS
jgi:4'-phosphopantetheinyl transferase